MMMAGSAAAPAASGVRPLSRSRSDRGVPLAAVAGARPQTLVVLD